MDTAMSFPLLEPHLTPAEVVNDTLDAVDAGTNGELVAGALTKATYEALTADLTEFQAKASTRLHSRHSLQVWLSLVSTNKRATGP